jgi:hypothetical protein
MLANTQTDVHMPVDSGPLVQAFLTADQLGLTAPGSSSLIPSGGYPRVAVGATSSATGSISVQRYLDAAGAIVQGPVLTQALSAGVAGVLNVSDGAPFQSFRVTMSGGTLSNVGALLQSR